jgi:hypothetical protein
MKKLTILYISLICTITICKAQKSMVSTDKTQSSEIKNKNIAPTDYHKFEDENFIFPTQTFNETLESQLKQDGLLGQTDKLLRFQLTDKVLIINAKAVDKKYKDKYLNLYYSFTKKANCQGCFVSYIIE